MYIWRTYIICITKNILYFLIWFLHKDLTEKQSSYSKWKVRSAVDGGLNWIHLYKCTYDKLLCLYANVEQISWSFFHDIFSVSSLKIYWNGRTRTYKLNEWKDEKRQLRKYIPVPYFIFFPIQPYIAYGT